ncbi:Hypothetical protein ABZS17G119_03991 [Kosakonia cowanii]|jgi:hypothetical protein
MRCLSLSGCSFIVRYQDFLYTSFAISVDLRNHSLSHCSAALILRPPFRGAEQYRLR